MTSAQRASAKDTMNLAVAGRVRRARIRAHMTQPELARRLGVSPSLIMRAEAAIHPYAIDVLAGIAHLLGCEVTEFVSAADGRKIARAGGAK